MDGGNLRWGVYPPGSAWGRQRQTSWRRSEPRWRGLLWAESPAHISPGLRLGETLGTAILLGSCPERGSASGGPMDMRRPFRPGRLFRLDPGFRKASTLG